MSQEIEKTTAAKLVKYSVTDSEIAKIKERFDGLKVTDKETYEIARKGISEVRTLRTTVEKKRKELKADALAYGRAVDGEAKRITALLVEIEEPLKAEKNRVDEEKRLEKERKEREAKEKEEARVNAIQGKIDCIRNLGKLRAGMDRDEMKANLKSLQDTEIKEDDLQEFAPEAISAKEAAIESMNDAILLDEERERKELELAKAQAEREAEEARLAAERQKLEAERAEAEAKAQAEREAMEKKEAELKAEREALEAKQRKIKEEAEAKRKADEQKKREEEEAAATKAHEEAMRPELEKLGLYGEQIAALIDSAPKLKQEDAKAQLSGVIEALEIAGRRCFVVEE
jgi:hypothetical protein